MAIEDNLYSGEKIMRKFHPSFWNYWAWYLFAALCILFILPLLLGVLVIAWKELERRSTTYLITDKRLMKEVGILGKRSISTIYQKITDIRSSQSFIQGILGIGDISINTAGGEGPEMNIRGIGDMPAIKKEIEQAWSGGSKA